MNYPDKFPEEAKAKEESFTSLLAACEQLLEAMNMQLKRESEEVHIPQSTAMAIWDEAMASARIAIAKAKGQQ